jgi:hypothetical protein
MVNGVNPDLVVREGMYSSTQHRDSEAFWAEKAGTKVGKLTDTITWMLGSYDKIHPLMSLEGYYGVKGIKARTVLSAETDGQYEYPVMTNLWYANEVAETNASLIPKDLGLAQAPFKVKFKRSQFKRGQIVITPNLIMARVESDPIKRGDNFEYEFQLCGNKSEAYMPATEVVAGTLWINIFNATSFERSYGSGSDVVYPAKVRNQVGYVQKTMTWGNKANLDRVMDFTFNVGGEQVSKWMSWYVWNFEKDWMSECEHAYWYSRFNRNTTTNTVTMKDFKTGESIPMGSGLIEQIQNTSTYTTLTAEMLLNKLTQAYQGQYDTGNMELTLYTGRGGIREFDRMVRTEYGAKSTQLNISTDSDKFLAGSGRELVSMGFFNEIHLIDGYKVKVKYNPLFDYGKVAQISPKHPTSGLPLESYRMVFVDDASHDGLPNIQYMNHVQEGYYHAWGGGLTDCPKDLNIALNGSIADAKAPQRSSETGEGFYTRWKSVGINLRRPNRCFMLEQVMA